MNLITDPILTLSDGDKVSLPGLFAAMTKGTARGFPSLRPHQRPAWHMFLAQLGALALWRAGRTDPPTTEREWAEVLRGLTPDHPDDAPWRLIVAERDKPAFMQPPVPEGTRLDKIETTPDALDMLITARNHDLKRAVAWRAAPEDWIFALVSLQTCEGYGGAHQYGIARMNRGSSSRPMLGLAPAGDGGTSLDPSAWWRRDVRRLLEARGAGRTNGLGSPGGHALLWLLDWPEGRQLDIRHLDPWFVEICRRVRLVETEGKIAARRGASRAARIDAEAFKGNVDDPWAPIERMNGKALTLSNRDFDYRMLCDLMFSGNWAVPLLAEAGDGETGGMLLAAEAFSRGNTKTEGFKSRVVPIPGKIVRFLSSDTTAMLSRAQMTEIAGFDKALRDALVLMMAHGEWDAVEKKHYARTGPACRRFDRAADRLFFPSLWRRIESRQYGDDAAFKAKYDFLSDLKKSAEIELKAALPTLPCSAILRPRAEARARRAFMRTLRGDDACRDLFSRDKGG